MPRTNRLLGVALVTILVGKSWGAENVQETAIGSWTDEQKVMARSIDGQHMLGVLRRAGKDVVTFDGKEVGAFEAVDNMRSNVMHPLLEQVWHATAGKYPTISGDGKHYAFVVHVGNSEAVIYDGKAGPSVHQVDCMGVTQDSAHFVYSATESGKMILMMDGAQVATGLYAKHIVQSRDGTRLAYAVTLPHVAPKESNTFVYCDGKEGPKYFGITNICFSPDGQHLSYIAQTDSSGFAGRSVVVLDGKEVGECHFDSKINFSNDGKHFGYEKGEVGIDSMTLIMDGKESRPFTRITQVSFSPDSQRWGYLMRRDGKGYFVLDGKETPSEADGTSGYVQFSPDSKRYAYNGVHNIRASVLVLDGKSVGAYEQTGAYDFSPDSTRFAFAAKKNGTWSIVEDGKEGPAFDEIGSRWFLNSYSTAGASVFSEDSKHLAYWGLKKEGREQWVLVVDGKEFGSWDRVGGAPFLNFQADNSLEFLAVRNGKLLRVKVAVDN